MNRTKEIPIGEKFNDWEIIKFEGYNSEREASYWRCKCICGFETIKAGGDLRAGRSKRCRICAGKKIRKPKSFVGQKQFLHTYKRNAKLRNYSWELSDEVALEISQKNCYYCDMSPSTIWYSNTKTRVTSEALDNGKWICNGIDRIDNNIGYTLENSVPCCKRCNIAKSDSSVEEFITWASNLIANQNRKQNN
jgi:hypothetical protein